MSGHHHCNNVENMYLQMESMLKFCYCIDVRISTFILFANAMSLFQYNNWYLTLVQHDFNLFCPLGGVLNPFLNLNSTKFPPKFKQVMGYINIYHYIYFRYHWKEYWRYHQVNNLHVKFSNVLLSYFSDFYLPRAIAGTFCLLSHRGG